MICDRRVVIGFSRRFPLTKFVAKDRVVAMDVPEEFHRLCISFYPHSHERYASEDEWIAGTLAFFRGPEKQVLNKFLNELLSGRHSDAELERVWQDTYPTYGFRPGGLRVFLTKIRDTIG
jgi:hypothetical protein